MSSPKWVQVALSQYRIARGTTEKIRRGVRTCCRRHFRDGRCETIGVACSHRAGFGRPLPCTIEELDGESLIVR